MSLQLSFRHMKPRDEVRRRVEALYAKLAAFLKETGARFPTPNPHYSEARHQRDQEWQRTKGIARLEKEHAAYLDPHYQPPGGWWQFRGK